MIDSLGIRVEDTFTVGIDLEKALSNPKGNADLVLREGDVISIPKNTNTVTINGAVMVPNTVSYMQGKDDGYRCVQQRRIKRRIFILAER